MFTLYQIVKRSVSESVPDRASVHNRNAAFEVVSASEQYCSAPLLKVEHSILDRFLKRSESSLNTSIGLEIATGPCFGNAGIKLTGYHPPPGHPGAFAPKCVPSPRVFCTTENARGLGQ